MDLLLPRGYLSYSQMTCWKSSPARYRREYFENGKKLDSKYLRFGKQFAQMLEDGQIAQIPRYSAPEHEIKTIIGNVPCLSFIDSYEPTEHIFIEYKTGKIPWTQSKVQKHEQLVFYATALKSVTGIMPQYCHLIWIPTEENQGTEFWDKVDKRVMLSDKEPMIFKREFDEREIVRMEKEIVKVALQISVAYRAFIEEQI